MQIAVFHFGNLIQSLPQHVHLQLHQGSLTSIQKFAVAEKFGEIRIGHYGICQIIHRFQNAKHHFETMFCFVFMSAAALPNKTLQHVQFGKTGVQKSEKSIFKTGPVSNSIHDSTQVAQ